jgi:hypothetical protein
VSQERGSMNTPKWTPGPWRTGDYGDQDALQFDIIAKLPEGGPVTGEQTILTTIHGPRSEDQDKANATLATAAPELYTALEAILDCFYSDVDQSWLAVQARAALLKANPERKPDEND